MPHQAPEAEDSDASRTSPVGKEVIPGDSVAFCFSPLLTLRELLDDLVVLTPISDPGRDSPGVFELNEGYPLFAFNDRPDNRVLVEPLVFDTAVSHERHENVQISVRFGLFGLNTRPQPADPEYLV